MTDITSSRALGAFPRDTIEYEASGEALPALSWQAVVAGALATTMAALLLVALGSGMGLASVSPWPSNGATGGTCAIATAVWLIVVQWVSAGLGEPTGG